MNIIRKLLFSVLSICLLLSLCSCSNNNDYSFKYWNKDANSLNTIIDYVNDVTDEKSVNYIPEEDRIVVFDMDGTLCGEESPVYIETLLLMHRVLDDPNYSAPDDVIEYVKSIKALVDNNEDYDETEFSYYFGLAFKGMTVDEFEKYVLDFINNTICEGYDNLTYADAIFLPMIEIVDYLNNKGFKTFICSGTDRATCRAILKDHINIKPENIIGRDIVLLPNDYEGSSKDSYEYKYENTLVRSSEVRSNCWQGDKVNCIVTDIGKQPVMVFGNSLGDTSMAIYATDNNKYKSIAIMVKNDDTLREHGDIEKYEKRSAIWDEYGWTTISIKDDWLTIYGFDITMNNH